MRYFYLIIILIPLTMLAEKQLVKKVNKTAGRYALQCLDTNHCISIDDFSPYIVVSETRDQGETWEEKFRFESKTVHPFFTGIKSSYVLDENHMYFASWQRGILAYTSDGGKTIEHTEMGTFTNGAEYMHMMDTLRGIIPNGNSITVTHDGWKTWTDIATYKQGKPGNHLINFHALPRSDSTYYITSTYNQGTFEEPEYIKCLYEFNINTYEIDTIYLFPAHPDDIDMLYDPILYFLNDSIGFYGGSVHRSDDYFRDVVLYKTIDGGKSWYKVLDHFDSKSWGAEDLAMRDSLYGIIASRPNRLYETFDGGETWEFVLIEDEGSHVLMFVEFAGQEAIIGSLANGMYKWEEPDTTDVGIKETKYMRVKHKNNHLFIFTKYNNLNISIYDIRGQLWIDEKIFQSGNINLQSLQNGVYFYNISTIGQIVKTGKFSIIN